MARTTRTKKTYVQTDEEKRTKAKEFWESEVRISPSIIRDEAAYAFKVGDAVVCGFNVNPVVEEVLSEGKAYLIRTGKKDDYRYIVRPWHELRPIYHGISDFSLNEDVQLVFNNATINSVILRYHYFGVNMEPDYQREYVWDDKDREMLLDSIFYNADIGKIVFNQLGCDSTTGNLYEIIDGKQRLSTLASYHENRWPYRGVYYNELSGKDRSRFLNHSLPYADLTNADRATVLQVFLVLNKGGRPMDPEQLRKVEAMYEALKESE